MSDPVMRPQPIPLTLPISGLVVQVRVCHPFYLLMEHNPPPVFERELEYRVDRAMVELGFTGDVDRERLAAGSLLTSEQRAAFMQWVIEIAAVDPYFTASTATARSLAAGGSAVQHMAVHHLNDLLAIYYAASAVPLDEIPALLDEVDNAEPRTAQP